MTVVIPNSTALRFVQVNSDGSALTGSLPNYTNRLNYHWTNVPNSEIFDVGFQFLTGDIVQNQFLTDADTITIELFNYDDETLNTDLSGNEVEVIEYANNLKVYDFDIDTALLGGRFYVRYTFAKAGDPTQYWQSERFDVDAFSTDNTALIEWQGSDRDGVYNPTSKYYYFRLPCRFFKINFGGEKAQYIDSDYDISQQDGAAVLNQILEFGDTAYFVAEKVKLALQHTNFRVNGVEYFSEEDLEIETFESDVHTTNIVLASVVLRKAEYENYTDYVQEAPVEEFCILIDTSDNKLLWNDTDCLLWSS